MVESGVPRIVVLAGPNGAGKSSFAGRAIERSGGTYFNPDEQTRLIRAKDPALPLAEANSQAWAAMRRLLLRAIDERKSITFESTLGGETIPSDLRRAAEAGFEVIVWFIALATVDMHIQRVANRVASGGHNIPEADIRARYVSSPQHLIQLLPLLSEAAVYDNSATARPGVAGEEPEPLLVLKVENGLIVDRCDDKQVPRWARPILDAAERL